MAIVDRPLPIEESGESRVGREENRNEIATEGRAKRVNEEEQQERQTRCHRVFISVAKAEDGVDGGGFASKQVGTKTTDRSNGHAVRNGREVAGREQETHAGYELPSSVYAR
jgi:hypothetical protein